MKDENAQPAPVSDEQERDIDTTPTQTDQPALSEHRWTMPEPVFRKTSGYLPQGFEPKFTAVSSADETGPDAFEPAHATPVEPESPKAVDIEPQPDVLADLDEMHEIETPAVAVNAPQRSGAGKIVMILLGLILFVVITTLFAAVVWYILSPGTEATIN
jgi:hypothetical protein